MTSLGIFGAGRVLLPWLGQHSNPNKSWPRNNCDVYTQQRQASVWMLCCYWNPGRIRHPQVRFSFFFLVYDPKPLLKKLSHCELWGRCEGHYKVTSFWAPYHGWDTSEEVNILNSKTVDFLAQRRDLRQIQSLSKFTEQQVGRTGNYLTLTQCSLHNMIGVGEENQGVQPHCLSVWWNTDNWN